MNKYALVVGVSTYDDPDISDLGCAAADAREIGKALREICGFSEVHELVTGGEREPLHVNIVDSLCSLAPTLTPDDMFLLYFAGHGIVTDSGTHLLTRNSRIQMPQLASLSWKTLSDCLSNISCADRVLIMDACRNDPHRGRGEEDNLMTERFSRDIMAIAETKVEEVTPATCVLFSCRTGERAYEWPEKGHGAFTHYLLEGLRGKALDAQGRITVGGLGRYAEERVPQWAKKTRKPLPQRPWGERKGSMREIVLSTRVIKTPRGQTINEPETMVQTPENEEPKRADWYYVHPAVKREWLERCGETVTIQMAENGKTTEISHEKVLQRGIVKSISYKNGSPILNTSSTALFLAGEKQILLKLLSNDLTQFSMLQIMKLIIAGKIDKARYEFTKATVNKTSTIDSIVIQHRGLDNSASARKELQKFERNNKRSAHWNSCASLWKTLFNESAEIKRCLNEAKNKADNSYDWRECAESWKQLFGNDGEAMRCLQAAERKAKDNWNWIRCAESWKQLFGDDGEAMRCLQAAERKAEDSSDWGRCAESWKQLFGDDGEAMRCLQAAERKAEDSSDWRWCAESWKQLFGDDGEAMRCLQAAERKADRSSDWRWCAESWKQLFGDDGEAMRCLQAAERKAEDSSDWRWCAESWKQLFGDDGEAMRCLQAAERKADRSSDWRWCAKSWKQLFADDGEAMKCLQAAERKAEDSSDWRWCAESWKKLLADETEAMECLENAEKSAERTYHWISCAESWKKLFHEDNRAAHCIRCAERKAKTDYNWERCAETWLNLFNNEYEALRCRKEVEKIIP